MTKEKIEILPVELLDQNRELVNALKETAHSLKLEFGWHYLLDLTWIIYNLQVHLGQVSGKRIMDAGAGVGVLQWRLAREGADVISVDRLDRKALSMHFRRRCRVRGLREADLLPPQEAFKENLTKIENESAYRIWNRKALFVGRELKSLFTRPNSPGQVLIYNQDLTNLVDLGDNSLDAVVSVSALEHNTPDGLEQVVKEIMRVLKPGGALLATLVAGRDQDWWHEDSSAWCYTDTSLRRIFKLPPDTPSNYQHYDELFTTLYECSELKDNLAKFYFQSDKNGMPWGKWNPQYQPVGVYKIK